MTTSAQAVAIPGTGTSEIADLVRRARKEASQLPLAGGSVSGSFAFGESRFEIGLRIRPYTEDAKKAKHQGRVVLRTVIDEQGLVKDAEVVEGQPYGLSEAAMAAVRTWRFHPALNDGEPTAVLYRLTVNIRLQ